MPKSILDKLLKVGIPIVKPGTTVRLLKTNEEVYIRTAFVYPDQSIAYTGYILKPENQRQELNVLYPSEIKDYNLVLSSNLKPVEIEPVETVESPNFITALNDIYTEIVATRLAVYHQGTLYGTDTILNQFNDAEDAYSNLLVKYELRTSSVYGYIQDNILLANDSYVVMYYRHNKQDVFIPVDYITREVKLKPFIKRVFNTLLYGRSHYGNFSYIESNTSYTTRLLEAISNQQKERGHIQYNKTEVTI